MIRKNRLILIVSLLLVAGFVVTSQVSFLVSRDSLRSQITENQLPLTSDNIYSEIQRDLLSPILISSLMATDTFLRDWVVQGERDPGPITRYLREINKKYNTFTSFFVSERTRTYYHADGILKKVSPDEPRDAWYFRVRQMAPDFEINVDPDMANRDTMTIFINYRVYDERGNYIGATGVGLNVGSVVQLIETYQQRYGREIYFIDQQGSVRLQGSTFPKTATTIFQMEGLSGLADQILANQNHKFAFRAGGETVHLSTRYIPEFKWFLLVEQKEEKALRSILRALLINLAICAVITIIVVYLINMTINSYRKRLEKMATEDRLTGAYNRHAFDIMFKQALKEAHRSSEPFSVILFDLDDFKILNDRFGHLAGDAVLKNIVTLTLGSIRDSDMLFRWGGEEFLVLLKECDRANATGMAEKIRHAIKGSPTLYKDQAMPITVSIGVAQHQPTDDGESLLGRADAALFRAKENGKDRSESDAHG